MLSQVTKVFNFSNYTRKLFDILGEQWCDATFSHIYNGFYYEFN